jgi:hypothetical protein
VRDEILRCAQYMTNKVITREAQCPEGQFVRLARGFNRPAKCTQLSWCCTQNDKVGALLLFPLAYSCGDF